MKEKTLINDDKNIFIHKFVNPDWFRPLAMIKQYLFYAFLHFKTRGL